MNDIFIGYASEDRGRAAMLASALKNLGWSVWWDRTIPAGRAFDEVIEEAIEAARCVVVLWSNASVASRWVRMEAEEGARRNILVPVLVEGVEIPLAFRRVQAVDLAGWQGDTSDAVFLKFASDVADVLGRYPSAPEDYGRRHDEADPIAALEAKRKSDERGRRQAEAHRRIELEARKASISTAEKLLAPRKRLLASGAVGIVIVVVAGAYVMHRSGPEPLEDTGRVQYSKVEWQDIQEALNNIGFDAGAPDGIPGFKTRIAITQFQERRGFAIGELTRIQRARLFSDARDAVQQRHRISPCRRH